MTPNLSVLVEALKAIRAEAVKASANGCGVTLKWLAPVIDQALAAMPQGESEDRTLEIIREWKHFWMNQTQNSEEDRKNYFDRAFGVDANMMHDLANRIARPHHTPAKEREE